MNITLTYTEGRTVIGRVPPAVAERLRSTRRHAWNKSHVYTLPAVGWRGVLDELRSKAYGPRGGYNGPTSLYTAIAKITTAVREWELHPAFVRGRGVVGVSADVVPAFLNGLERSPYPPGEFALLLPKHVMSHGRVLTVWERGDWSPGEEALHGEHLHHLVAAEVGFGGT